MFYCAEGVATEVIILLTWVLIIQKPELMVLETPEEKESNLNTKISLSNATVSARLCLWKAKCEIPFCKCIKTCVWKNQIK